MARRRVRNKTPAGAAAVPGETVEQKLARLEAEVAALKSDVSDRF